MHIPFERIPSVSTVCVFGPGNPVVSGIAYNSQHVKPGFVFVAITGELTDGHAYIGQALANGASAVIGTNAAILAAFAEDHPSTSFVVTEDAREAMAYVADYFYGHVQERLVKVGVTGTNGKTTVATYVQRLFNLLHIPCGMLGTTGIWKAEEKMAFYKSTPTTPMSADIHCIFDELHRTYHEAAAMEVSSIALDQKRVEGIEFDIAIHTNFSEEHLEYHKTMDHYKQSKLRLFKQAAVSVVNADDKGMGQDILAAADRKVTTYSGHPDTGADLTWTNCRHTAHGMTFELAYEGETYTASVPLYGTYNAGNVTAAIAAALALGIDIEEIISVLPDMQQAEGRFQVIHAPENRKVVIDYAHTPVALDQILTEVRHIPHNRLIALIAGIGIRDFGKMPKMARAAEGKADILVVTVDHPGDHDPNKVIQHVLSGFKQPSERVLTAETRKEAVLKALEESGPNDIVLLTSGCINGCQIVKGEHIPHSDENIVHSFFHPVQKIPGVYCPIEKAETFSVL